MMAYGTRGPSIRMPKSARKAGQTQPQPQAATCGPQFVQIGQQHAKDKTGQVRQRRVFERLQPWTPTPAVGMRNSVRIEQCIERAGNHAQHPHHAQLNKIVPSLRALPPRQPWK